MNHLHCTKRFRQDVRRAKRRSKDLTKLNKILHDLKHGVALLKRYRNHQLWQGGYSGAYELHLEPDHLLIYRLTGNSLLLIRLGSHADLF